MTDSALYWIWLTQAIGFNNPKYKRICELYNSIADFYNGGVREWTFSGIFSDKEITALSTTRLDAAHEIIEKCKAKHFDILCIDEENYPKKLFNIYAPPAVLYVWGSMPDFDNRLSIAMVGTRKATQYGVMASHVLSSSLSKLGVIIVSGGAVGIDSASHIGALEASGTTVCVLGCGIDYNYLPQNAQMRHNIASTGAVITEYPPGVQSLAYHFPERNRIISGLSDGVVVVEADKKSGSLITVNCALEQNREVFAVMGNINSRYSSGTNQLIKDGATPVTSYQDIIESFENYHIETPHSSNDNDDIDFDVRNSGDINKQQPVHKDTTDLSDTAKRIYLLINAEPVHIDQLVSGSGLPVNKVLSTLTELELLGLIEAQRGRMYKLV